MFSLLDNSAAGFSLEMEIRIYQDENLYMYLHTRLQKLRKRKSIIVHMMQGRRTRGGGGEIGECSLLSHTVRVPHLPISPYIWESHFHPKCGNITLPPWQVKG